MRTYTKLARPPGSTSSVITDETPEGIQPDHLYIVSWRRGINPRTFFIFRSKGFGLLHSIVRRHIPKRSEKVPRHHRLPTLPRAVISMSGSTESGKKGGGEGEETKPSGTYEAGCHCGYIKYSVTLSPPFPEYKALNCNCSACTKLGYLLICKLKPTFPSVISF